MLSLLVEGVIDEVVGRRLLQEAGIQAGATFGKDGHGYITKKIRGFNASAAGMPLLVLADSMDTQLGCAPRIVDAWLPARHPNLLLRIVDREIESWLLADRSGISRFLGVPEHRVPHQPDHLDDPKAEIMRLAAGSHRKRVREALVPDPGGSATVGRLYNSEMVRFVTNGWEPESASSNSPSLARARRAIRAFAVR